MIDEKYLLDTNILNIYKFGSHVYGTNNKTSDDDYIFIVTEYVDYQDKNIQVYTITQFNSALTRCEIQALECLYLNKKFILKESIRFNRTAFRIDLNELRQSISTISNNSWVKGKKKLIISGDYEPYIAIKSVFHSLRILDYGIQIASENRISDYESMNWLYLELMKLYKQYQRNELWEIIDTRYRKILNSKKSEFKKLAPKTVPFNIDILNQWLNKNAGIKLTPAQFSKFQNEIINKYF